MTTLIVQNPVRFKTRTAALQFAQDLFRKGTIKSIHGARFFEDSELLYVWQDENQHLDKHYRSMTSSEPTSSINRNNNADTVSSEAETKQKSLINDFFKDLEEDFPDTKNTPDVDRSGHYASLTPWAIQRASTASSDSSADTISHSYSKYKNTTSRTSAPFSMATTRDHEAIPEETSIERAEGHSLEMELDRSFQRMGEPSATRRWPDSQYCYSDNEKQLIEEMKRMKRDHTEIVKSYEDRVSKLMTKMGELRSIAEMLENSGTKPNSCGVFQKSSLLNLIGKIENQTSLHKNFIVKLRKIPFLIYVWVIKEYLPSSETFCWIRHRVVQNWCMKKKFYLILLNSLPKICTSVWKYLIKQLMRKKVLSTTITIDTPLRYFLHPSTCIVKVKEWFCES